jgi:uncharacterized protein
MAAALQRMAETPRPIDWPSARDALDREGFARLGQVLDPAVALRIAEGFDEDRLFRSTIEMARHGFGQGRYRYYADPLPETVAGLRRDFYAELAPIANAWAEALGEERRFPPTHAAFRAQCAAVGQTRPTPLLLRYGPGDHNRLHQDLYGELVFPIQVVVLLDRPGEDFTGGELVLVEGRARRQSRAHVVPLVQGEAVAFAVSRFPGRGGRATLRHGVATVHSGLRRTLGIIFHDSK